MVPPMARRSEAPGPCYSERLDEALRFAAEQFRFRVRKGSGVPYVTHLLQVCCTVGEYGGDEEQMVAAVLHDYLEDVHGAHTDVLVARFGERVARLVMALSDSTTHPKPSWSERKERYVERLRTEPAELKLISAADKLHNAQCIVRDQVQVGDQVFERFSADKAQTLWYYRAVVAALSDGWDHVLLNELDALVDRMHALGGVSRG
jgi:(p)ppGpp synthase/HD superfamily hydrolase